MVWGALAGLAAGTAAALSAPLIAQEVIKFTQPESVKREYSKPAVQSAMAAGEAEVKKSAKIAGGIEPILAEVPGIRVVPFKEPKPPKGFTFAYEAGRGIGEAAAKSVGLEPQPFKERTSPAYTYQSAVYKSLIEKGYSEQKAAQIAKGAADLYVAGGAGEAAGVLSGSAFAESIGATAAQKLIGGLGAQATKRAAARQVALRGAAASGLGGVYEGALTTGTSIVAGTKPKSTLSESVSASSKRLQENVGLIALGGLFGGFSAGVLGGAIAGSAVVSSKVSKGIEYGASLLDVYEKPADILAGSLMGRAGFKGVNITIGRGGRVFTPSLSIPSLTSAFSQTPSPTTTQTPSSAVTPSQTPTPTTQTTGIFESPVITLTPTPTTEMTGTFEPPAFTIDTTPEITPTESTPGEAETAVSVPSVTTTTTATSIPSTAIVPKFAPFLPFPPGVGGGGGSGRVYRGGRVAYFNEFLAARRAALRLI